MILDEAKMNLKMDTFCTADPYIKIKRDHMFTRQKILLGMLKRTPKAMSKTQLVKLAFLFSKERKFSQIKSFYGFVPYKFGPFSFHIYHDLQRMIDTGYLVSNSAEAISISGKVPVPEVDSGLSFEIDSFLHKYLHISTKDITKHVYKNYPWYTINSSNPKLRLNKRPIADIAVYTAGYESMQIDDFMNMLLKCGVLRLIDVRHNPVARRYGFHRKTILKICNHLGIEYYHTPELGIPPELRTYLNSPEDYSELFNHYNNTVLMTEKASIRKVTNIVLEKPSVLVCMEADRNYCHRKLLSQKISDASSLPIIELRR